jgi:hypothetical protein
MSSVSWKIAQISGMCSRLLGNLTVLRIMLMKLLKVSDYRRWRNEQSLRSDWDGRTKLIAQQIPAHSSVLEIGAGRMILRNYLSGSSKYTPADLISRVPEMIALDLNAKNWPTLTHHNYIIFSGVLEYIYDLKSCLTRVHGICDHIICSYASTDFEHQREKKVRRSHGWVNDYASQELEDLLAELGYSCTWRGMWRDQYLYQFSRIADQNM